MKKTFLLFTLSLLLVGVAWGQGLETFDNMPETGSTYSDGTFLGQDGSTWTYVQSRSDFDVTGNSCMLGRNRDPQSNVYSGTISGGIGTLTFNYMQVYSTNVNLNVLVNDIVVGNVTSSAEQGLIKNSGTITVNVPGDFVIKFINANNSDGQVCVDDVTWSGYAGNPTAATPEITPGTGNFYEAFDASITCSTPDASIYYTTDGTDPTDTSTPYTGPVNITQTTTLKAIAYATGYDPSLIAEAVYTFIDPAITTLPYNEPFDADLGDCYVYSVSGDTKEWTWASYSGNGYAYMNGYNSGDTEDDWLILPGMDLDAYGDARMYFDTWYNYGTDDTNNYLKLYYSTDYAGYGDPTLATWTELVFTHPTSSQTWTSSGMVDLTGITGSFVNLAFQYHYEVGSYRSWEIDNIVVEEIPANLPPEITNVTQTPDVVVMSTDTVSVSAEITDADGTISLAQLQWGTETGVYPNTINMTPTTRALYTTDTDIPAQLDGTTVYYVVYAEDDLLAGTTSAEFSYTVT
ncbi:MAG: chitobiase/beta-hexosaminidase C-terminal domain-containing protein, partial [Candidatus Syntrophosphaera sp.]